MDISAEIKMKCTVREGSVFYFTEETFVSNEPHYFVVLNSSPLNNKIIVLVDRTFEAPTFEPFECMEDLVSNLSKEYKSDKVLNILNGKHEDLSVEILFPVTLSLKTVFEVTDIKDKGII